MITFLLSFILRSVDANYSIFRDQRKRQHAKRQKHCEKWLKNQRTLLVIGYKDV